ncbi:DUF2911 domain-containing protein [Wenyingzhuangia sp. IMCC45533]
MKKLLFILSLVLICIDANAQEFKGIDKSPLDVILLKQTRNAEALVKIYYSRPQKNGRELFGELVPFDKVWRLGANEATEIKVTKDIAFGNKKLPIGNYTMYAIPSNNYWTVIINKKVDTWGAYTYDKSLDVLRVKVPVEKTEASVEHFSMKFSKINSKKEASLVMAWGTTKITVPIKL